MILFVIKPLLRTTIFIRPANKVTNLFVFLKTNYSLLGWRYSRDATTLPLKNSVRGTCFAYGEAGHGIRMAKSLQDKGESC